MPRHGLDDVRVRVRVRVRIRARLREGGRREEERESPRFAVLGGGGTIKITKTTRNDDVRGTKITPRGRKYNKRERLRLAVRWEEERIRVKRVSLTWDNMTMQVMHSFLLMILVDEDVLLSISQVKVTETDTTSAHSKHAYQSRMAAWPMA